MDAPAPFPWRARLAYGQRFALRLSAEGSTAKTLVEFTPGAEIPVTNADKRRLAAFVVMVEARKANDETHSIDGGRPVMEIVSVFEFAPSATTFAAG